MSEVLAEVSWSCPTCRKRGKVGFSELGIAAYGIMKEVKESHHKASPDCKVSYPNFSAPHPPTPDQPEVETSLPKAFSVIMYPDEVFLITMCMYVAQCIATGIEPYPTAVAGVKHWMDAVGLERINVLSKKLQKIANIENMETVLHVVYADGK